MASFSISTLTVGSHSISAIYDGDANFTSSTSAPLTETVNNSPPFAVNDSYTVTHDQLLSVDALNTPGVLANDGDADGDPITAVLVSSPSNGTLWYLGSAGDFMYFPNPGFVGFDSFTYQANDGTANSNTATVAIQVTNSPPTANNDTYGVHPGITLNVPAAGVLSNDTDPNGDPLTANLVSGPSHGTLTLNPDGSLTYTPNQCLPSRNDCRLNRLIP